VDQSECANEEAIANTCIRHIDQLLSYVTKVLVYKIQYATPFIINKIAEEFIEDGRFSKVLFLKPMASGPYSIEGYLCMAIRGENYINPTNLRSWLASRRFCGRTVDR
jgi:hypothetical protein